MGNWKTINDFRLKYGITRQAVWNRIYRKTLKTKIMVKKIPTTYVWDEKA